MNLELIVNLSYLLASALFIIGLKQLSSPKTARAGNTLAAIGMLLAIAVTLMDQAILSFSMILVGVLIGSVIGAASAYWVKMTAMPQMVAVFNGFGGGASALIAWSEFNRLAGGAADIPVPVVFAVALILLIGVVTLTGSLVAFGKLQEVIPIGGADMPIVVSLLNSYSGLAGAAAGFVIGSNILIIAGALVGASGIILTQIMCRGMNRSLINVVFGGFGTGSGGSDDAGGSAVPSARRLRKKRLSYWVTPAR